LISSRSLKKVAASLILVSIVLGATLACVAYALTEGNYNFDFNFLTGTESTQAENGYKANIVIDPIITGVIANESGFILDLTISPQGIGGAFAEGNYRLDLIPDNAFPNSANVAVTNVAASKAIVGQGDFVLINVTLSNQGLYYGTFYLVINANATAINGQNITLTSMSSATINFTWNTTGFALGNYTIGAYALPVPGEINTADNTFVGGTVEIIAGMTGGGGSRMPYMN
jgi:hypothetical protein